ncbi:MAG: Type 1 glutamine amidotransferase-like domain-containing protein [Thermoanaerobaculia bacterium]
MTIILLGPQRLHPTLATVVSDQGIEGPIAAVTAGWQEREDEDHDLRDHLGGRTRNLRLYRRAETVFREDPELFTAYRARQDRLKGLRELYRLRLSYAMEAARALQTRTTKSLYLKGEIEAAIEEVRRLDRHHLELVSEIHAEFERDFQPAQRPSVERQRREIATELSECAALAIAGGHVAALLNRLRLFNLVGLLESQTILAWSAGAMVLGSQIVVFHDSPPQGAGHAEVFESGLGVFSDLLPLPHAERRLLLSDLARVALMSRRSTPLSCIPLDEGAELIRSEGRWAPESSINRLTDEGTVLAVKDPWPVQGGTVSI